MMDVQLGNYIAQRGNVDFVRLKDLRQATAEKHRFGHQLLLVCF